VKIFILCMICFLLGSGTSYFFLQDRIHKSTVNRLSSERPLYNLLIGGATEFQNGNTQLGNDVITFILRQRLMLLEKIELIPDELVEHKQKIEIYLKQFPASDCAGVPPADVIDCHLNQS